MVPTLPLGGHRLLMRTDADPSVLGVARLVAEFLDRLDLRDATLVLNDRGGALALVSDGRDQRIGRLVVTSCEAFDNFPPGLPGRSLVAAAKLPGGLHTAFGLLRWGPARRLPVTWGWMTRRPVPAAVMDDWFRGLWSSAQVRRDLRRYVLGVPPKAELLRWSEALRGFDRPALVAWAGDDRVMPPEHGRRLRELFPDSTYVGIPGSYTLIPEDAPQELIRHLRTFLLRERNRPH